MPMPRAMVKLKASGESMCPATGQSVTLSDVVGQSMGVWGTLRLSGAEGYRVGPILYSL